MTLVDANPDGLHPLPGVVTHVVTVAELALVYTSGRVAWDKDGNLVGDGDYANRRSRSCAISTLRWPRRAQPATI